MGKTGQKYKNRGTAGYSGVERTNAYGNGKGSFWDRKETKMQIHKSKTMGYGRGGAPSGGIWTKVA